MRTPVNRLIARQRARFLTGLLRLTRLLGCGAGLALLAAPAASAADGEIGGWGGSDGWVPSLAITSGVDWQRQFGSVTGDCRDGDPMSASFGAAAPCDSTELLASQTSVLGEPNRGDDLSVTPYVGGSLQLLSPTIPGIPGSPRLFLSGELPYHFPSARNIAQSDAPTGLAEPDSDLKNPGPETNAPEEAIKGDGNRTQAEMDGLIFGASAGLAFPFEAWGRRFLLKTSAGWIRYKIDVETRSFHGFCPRPVAMPATLPLPSFANCDLDGEQGVDRVIVTQFPLPPIFLPSPPGFTRQVVLLQEASRWFDGIGPGVELEMDTGRVGPLGISLFLSAHAYYVLTDRDVSLVKRTTIGNDNLIPNGGNPGEGLPVDYGVEGTFRVAPWMYRAGIGLRFHWLGSR